jgi:hypothetical protein
MVVTTLDTIVRSILLRKRYGMSYYLDCLLAGRDSLRELMADDLHVINTTKATVDEFGCVDIPEDAASVIGVGYGNGQMVGVLVEDSRMNSLQNMNDTFHAERYDERTDPLSPPLIYGYFANIWGSRLGSWGYSDTYKVISERGQIQLNENLTFTDVYIMCVGDGRSADAATQVDVEAEACIESYILWQLVEHSRTYGLGEKERMRQQYLDQRKILRARKSDLTIPVLKRISQRNTWARGK